jgi:hypothetical protein
MAAKGSLYRGGHKPQPDLANPVKQGQYAASVRVLLARH